MTEKDLRRLRRRDLLEILLDLSKENEQLKKLNKQLQAAVEDRTISLLEVGSVAEASLKLNGVFKAAQDACDQYVYNARMRCQRMEEETKKRCERMLIDTENQVKQHEKEDHE